MTVKVPKTGLYERDGFSLLCDEVLYGWNAKALSVTDVFTLVNVPMYYSGFADIRDFSAKKYEPMHIVTSACVGAYEQPTFKSRELFVLYMGSKLKLSGKTDSGFSEVIGVDGESFFVHSSALSEIKSEYNPDLIISAAKKLLGAPYKWGGKTVCGIDCSGLLSMCYFMSGIEIYRDSDFTKTPCFVKKDIKDLSKGDAIYLKGHVGLYAGNGRVVHASWSKGCVTYCTTEEFLSYGEFVSAVGFART